MDVRTDVSDPHNPSNWPRWAFVASASCVAVLATMMTVVAERPEVVGPLALLVTVPWIDHALGRHPPRWKFLSLALAPLLAINTVLYDAAGPAAAAVSAMIVIFLQGECVGAYPPKRAALGVLLGGGVLGAHAVHADGLSSVYWIGGGAIAVTVGYLIRRQQETLIELRATQAQLVGEATLRERQRIAREVHDVIAHSMTVAMMHVTAARMAIDRDPQRAIETLEEAERLGRASLDEVRRTVGLLRSESDRATDAALPSASGVASLVADSRSAGVEVELEVDGDLDGVEGPAGLALYRVAQEAIANAAKHAPGAPVHVSIVVGDAVRARITNPIPRGLRAHGAGNGLIGMRERVQLLGGRVTAGPTSGRWTVECTIPATQTQGAVR